MLILLVALVDIGRRIVLANSLYRLNLRTQAPLDPMPPLMPGEKIVIFASHPDDETLGAGGYIQQAVSAGSAVRVVLMTNGEHPEISVILFEETVRMRPEAFIKLGYRRQGETLRAMRSLGLSSEKVTFLGYPNQYLDQMWLPAHWLPSQPVRSARLRTTSSPYRNSMTPHAVFCGQSVLQDIEAILLREQPDTVITLHPNDVHVDHWPTHTFVRFALDELAANGQAFAQKCRVYTYLIHRPYWPAPRGYRPFVTLEPPARLLATRHTDWYGLPLTVAQMIDKRKAIGMYRTQAGAIDPLLQSFARGNELFGVLPLRTWQMEETTPARVVILDPLGDLPTSAANPHADIASVTLQRKTDRMLVSIDTRRSASSRVAYHFSVHVFGRSERDRMIAQYDWTGTQATALIYRSGRIRKLNHSLDAAIRDGVMTLTAPWPITRDSQTFFMVRAWTSRANRVLDETETSTFSVSKGPEELKPAD